MASENVTTEKEEEEKRYVLVKAVHGYGGKKLHWVIAEKRKRDDWFLKGRPVDSLCGIHAPRIMDSLSGRGEVEENDFCEYEEDELFDELAATYRTGKKREKEKYWVYNDTGERTKPTMETIDDWKEGRVHLVTEYWTSEEIKQQVLPKMWCKQCQKVKMEQYPEI
jgi:hypothetical protein